LTTEGGSGRKESGEEAVRYRWVAEFLKGVDVLDVGCGHGNGSYFFTEHGARSVLGIDSDSKAIRYANRKYHRDNLRFELMDATKITLPPESFDAAVSLEVIEHLTNPLAMLRGIHSTLKPDGILVLSTPNKYHTETSYEDGKSCDPYHVKDYYPNELCDMLNDLFRINAIYGEFRVVADNERITYDRYVEHCTVPRRIRKLIPEHLKNAWLRRKGLPAIPEPHKDFQIEPLSAPEQLSGKYFVQLYVCEKQPNLRFFL